MIQVAKSFQLPDHQPEARLARLPQGQLRALEDALSRLSISKFIQERSANDLEQLPVFLLPLAEFGMTCDQMIRLVQKIPVDFSLAHREIYFDYRLNQWIKHIEPLTLLECMEEYYESAESPDQAMQYLKDQWVVFLKRNLPLASQRARWA